MRRFTRPELYERDRSLFQKYVPLCRQMAEAGWEPATGAQSSDSRVYLERFGSRYLTVFNDSQTHKTVTITLDRAPASSRELVAGAEMRWAGRQASLTLDSEAVAVIDLKATP